MSETAFPDTYLAELIRSKSAIISALAMLCVQQRRTLQKLENELEQLRAGKSDAAARRVVPSTNGR